ncbi:hypothetical protein [Vulcanisaeta distributa]|uniref:hypothetical protein n=1 Tax=Vulcanisaeta distributa TaxID=164451 RepID=UPI001FB2237D|nr:hypothetical protein [Vulcanisaeta distributa]
MCIRLTDDSWLLKPLNQGSVGGVKDKGSKRLKCGEEVDDPRIVEETMKLINEFLNRVERYEACC